jgi:fermentation-respiration switch protein FrsA (DUF1100 family)
MRLRYVLAGSALALLSPLTAHAGFNVTLNVNDTSVNLEQVFTASGTAGGCPNVAFTVTFTYQDIDGNAATATGTGTTDASGNYTTTIKVPNDADADHTNASAQASVACPGGAQTSNTVAMTVEIVQGTLTVSPTHGKAGTSVHVSGTNCLGDDILVGFTNGAQGDEVTVTLHDDNTFDGDYTIPNVAPGNWSFVASCPGTDFDPAAFTVDATPGASPTPLPSASAIPDAVAGEVNFTG